ncbi:MAG: branched-chain amino acid ABC transporter permease [Eubacterium aggregans]|uniref:Amino acid/amide ABC transporter membrane protein 2, HAAT family n=1 Tax=Eubacterium aggregans TaxID=81409 RepID=A0A1H4A4D0_9FIRM|nr:branched-chain amino acid ABC transporter permease [Eubacterium aggregans]MDD4691597.1 branched-chain amino acid ABC transporter permease [Eubacterium aggregans]MEA5074289.1 branched-chain amino acid ABC transporter permease [Eubacterium aggregans]SEA30816.1 amino acid/amide ABC transporter membrane protein 2, HAAT family [Eubacterium aggregans]
MSKNIKKSYIVNSIAILAIFAIIYSLITFKIVSTYFSGIVILTCIMIIMALSLNIVAGFLGEMALGHAGFMAIGAYVGASVSLAVTGAVPEFPRLILLIISSLVGGAAAGAVGILIGTPSLRLRGDYLGIVTIGFAEIIRIFFVNFEPTGGAQGLKGIPRLAGLGSVYWVMIIVAVLIFTLGRSRYGRAIMSIREDEIAAEAAGIPTTKVKVLAFTISSFFAGIGGSLYAHYQGYLDPSKFQFMFSIEMFVIVVLGGLGSLTGSILSAIVLTVLPELLRQFSEYRLLVYSLALIIMMIFRPQGMLGRYEFSLTRFIEGLMDKRRKTSDSLDGGDM